MTLAERIHDYLAGPPKRTMLELANEIGISLSYVSDLARGREPSTIMLNRFAKFFGVNARKFRAEAAAPTVVQMAAANINNEIGVVLLYSDGRMRVVYLERTTKEVSI